MNFRYKFIDDDVILTNAEHESCLEQLAKGINIVVLRNGKLILNLQHLKTVKETDTMTDDQEEAQYDVKKLVAAPKEETRRLASGASNESVHEEFMRRMAEKHGGQWGDAWEHSIWNPKNRSAWK